MENKYVDNWILDFSYTPPLRCLPLAEIVTTRTLSNKFMK